MPNWKPIAAILLVLAATPARAGPNAFWLFGWDRHYNHGTGGLADADLPVRTGRPSDAAVRVAAGEAAPAAIPPAAIPSAASPGRSVRLAYDDPADAR